MITYKFRAQDIASNKWLYGDIRHHKNDICIFEQGGNRGELVKPETIGQFTGLTDKNGKEIYEGDIITTGSGFYGVIKWSKYGYFYIHSDGDKEDPLDYATLGYMLRLYDFEVVGNVFDDPALIKKGGQDE